MADLMREDHELDLSIVITCYNQSATIETCLNLIRKQTEFLGIKVLVGDDCSTDSSVSVIVPIVETWDELTLFQSDENRGAASIRNTCANMVPGQWILFIDGDCLAEVGFVNVFLSAIGSKDINMIYQAEISYSSQLIKASNFQRFMNSRYYRAEDLDESSIRFHNVGGSGVAYPRELFNLAGGFEEFGLNYGGEDLVLAYKAHSAGGEFVFLSDAKLVHCDLNTPQRVRTKIESMFSGPVPLIHRDLPGALEGTSYAIINRLGEKPFWLFSVRIAVKIVNFFRVLEVLGRIIHTTDRTPTLYAPLMYKTYLGLAGLKGYIDTNMSMQNSRLADFSD